MRSFLCFADKLTYFPGSAAIIDAVELNKRHPLTGPEPSQPIPFRDSPVSNIGLTWTTVPVHQSSSAPGARREECCFRRLPIVSCLYTFITANFSLTLLCKFRESSALQLSTMTSVKTPLVLWGQRSSATTRKKVRSLVMPNPRT